MRDRLIELIKQAEKQFSETGKPVLDIEEYVADHLLAEGVIVPKVGIGAKIYAVPLYPRGVYEFEVAEISVELINDRNLFTYSCDGGWVFNDTHWGKTVFFTRDEAERALAERSNENGE